MTNMVVWLRETILHPLLAYYLSSILKIIKIRAQWWKEEGSKFGIRVHLDG